MADKFESHRSGLESPAENAATITASASALANATRAIWVGGEGNITVTLIGGQNVQFTNVPVGFLPVRATHVTAATATGLVGVW